MSHPTQYASVLEAAVRGEFNAAYARGIAGANDVVSIATRVVGSEGAAKFVELGNVPLPRRWVGERQFQSLRDANSLTVYADVWENTLSIPRRTVEDDQLGLVMARVREFANTAIEHMARQITLVLAQGTTRIAIDGQPLLSSTARGPGNANIGSAPLSTSALQEAISTMRQYRDETGQPFGVRPNVLLVGPKLQWVARELVESPIVVQANTTNNYTPYRNVLENSLRVVVSDYLIDAYDDYWYVLDTTRAMNAVGYYVKRDNELELQTIFDNESEYVKLNDAYMVGYRMRHEFFAGAWYTVYASHL